MRGGLAEHPRKIRNIVEGQFDALLRCYLPIISYALRTDSNQGYRRRSQMLEIKPGVILKQISPARWQQDMDQRVRTLRFTGSPLCRWMRPRDNFLKEDEIRGALRSIIWWPSVVQSAKGLLTANPGTALGYLGGKLAKRLASA